MPWIFFMGLVGWLFFVVQIVPEAKPAANKFPFPTPPALATPGQQITAPNPPDGKMYLVRGLERLRRWTGQAGARALKGRMGLALA
jgi:hypothetical protein